LLLELLARMERWLTHDGRAAVTPTDHPVLAPRFGRLAQLATHVAALAREFEVT
jgi:hypothetical protein